MPQRTIADSRRVETASPAAPGGGVEDLRTRVTIARTHPTDVKQRQVVVRIDDSDPITLLYGESMTVEVAAGAHKLRAHNTLMWRTVKFSVEPGEHLEFTLINRSPAWSYAMLSILGAGPLFLEVRQRSLLQQAPPPSAVRRSL